MAEPAVETPKIANRIATTLLVLSLSLANSALFYFVIWDMLDPKEPFSVILFYVSGGAHLVYLFLPWFVTSMLAPAFADGGSGRYGGGARTAMPETDNFFVRISTQFGVALCVTALALWALQLDWGFGADASNLALITKENCQQIGGSPELVGGRLVCQMPASEIRAAGRLVVPRPEEKI